jgi:hypothetical protein
VRAAARAGWEGRHCGGARALYVGRARWPARGSAWPPAAASSGALWGWLRWRRLGDARSRRNFGTAAFENSQVEEATSSIIHRSLKIQAFHLTPNDPTSKIENSQTSHGGREIQMEQIFFLPNFQIPMDFELQISRNNFNLKLA